MQWNRLTPRAEVGYSLALFLGLLAAGRTQMLADPGCFWHVVTGEKVLAHGFFYGDPYGYRDYHHWFAKDWLSELYFAFAHRISGPDGLLVATAVVLTAFFTALMRRFLSAGCHPMLAVFFTTFAVAGTSFHFFARPLIFTLVFVGWLFALLVDVEAGRKRLSAIWWSIPVIVLWANLHPGVLGGVGSVGLVGGWWILAWMLRWPTPVGNRRDAVVVAAWMGAAVLALFATPFGVDYVTLSVNLVRSPLLPLLIEEHRPAALLAPKVSEIALMLYAAFYVPFLICSQRRPTATVMVSLVWLALALLRIRNAELFVVSASMVVAEFLPRHPWAAWLAGRSDLFVKPAEAPVRLRPMPFSVYTPFLLVAVLCLCLQQLGVRAPIVGKGWADVRNKIAPVEVLDVLRAYEAEVGPGKPIFNDLNFGGFVIYFTPKLKVFIDDRCELYGNKGLLEYVDVNLKPELIDAWSEKWGYDLALVAVDSAERKSPFDLYLSKQSGWRCVKRGEVAAVYRKLPKEIATKSPVDFGGAAPQQ